jgi:tRNA-Thr(GGU) m(6)t(6)A37 methyltransferase TsaA
MQTNDAPPSVTIQPIARVSNAVSTPRTSGWERVESSITLNPELSSDLLVDLAGFSHLIIVFWLDRLPEDRPRPARINIEGAERSVLATRSQLRPSPIGVSVVSVVSVEGTVVRVLGLDALDGTPVLDLKPYIPYYDSVQAATVPACADLLPNQ